MELSVIKIMDGILMSSPALLQDQQFLLNNKISHTLGYLSSHHSISQSSLQQIGIKSLILPKGNSTSFLSHTHVEAAIDFLDESRDQYLVCLLYADDIIDCVPLLAAYLINHYHWMLDVSMAFLTRRLDELGINGFQQKIKTPTQQMAEIVDKIIPDQSTQLKYIQWNSEFLSRYKSDDCDEMILINTIKNSINLGPPKKMPETEDNDQFLTKRKKKRRIQWFDEVAKNSITAGQRLFANSKINSSFKKNNSQPKTSIKLGSNEQIINLINGLNRNQINRHDKENRSVKKLGTFSKDSELEDLEYLSLKEMSRTNFNDIKFKNMYKKKSLKMLKYKDSKESKDIKDNKVLRREKENLALIKSAQKFYENSNSSSLTFLKGIKALDLQHHS